MSMYYFVIINNNADKIQWYSYFKRFYVFFEKEEGREKEKERNINVWLPLMHLPPGTWPTTQARALTGNRSNDPLVRRLAPNPLSHTSQGWNTFLFLIFPTCHSPFPGMTLLRIWPRSDWIQSCHFRVLASCSSLVDSNSHYQIKMLVFQIFSSFKQYLLGILVSLIND